MSGLVIVKEKIKEKDQAYKNKLQDPERFRKAKCDLRKPFEYRKLNTKINSTPFSHLVTQSNFGLT